MALGEPLGYGNANSTFDSRCITIRPTRAQAMESNCSVAEANVLANDRNKWSMNVEQHNVRSKWVGKLTTLSAWFVPNTVLQAAGKEILFIISKCSLKLILLLPLLLLLYYHVSDSYVTESPVW